MKIKEIRQLEKNELNNKLDQTRKELIKINSQISTGTMPKSPGQVKNYKKTVAKILMVLKEKENQEKWVKYAQHADYQKNFAFVRQSQKKA